MSGKVIAVANMKGGVGKTTTVVAMAEALGALGHSVLVIDADAQANASVCIAGDMNLEGLISKDRTIDAFIDDVLLGGRKNITFANSIFEGASNVSHRGRPLGISLLASSSELRVLERDLIFELTEKNLGLNAIVGSLFRLMQHQLKLSENQYDYVLIDCAPGISAVTEASIRLADLVIIPTIPDFLSTYGLASFCKTMWKTSPYGGDFRPKALPRVLITRRRPVKDHDYYARLLENENRAAEPAFKTFETNFLESTEVAQALAVANSEATVTFTAKWGVKFITRLGSLVAETKEALNGA